METPPNRKTWLAGVWLLIAASLLTSFAFLTNRRGPNAQELENLEHRIDQLEADLSKVREQVEAKNQKVDSVAKSASYLLLPEDLEKFRAGRPKDELLDDVQWRGNLEMEAELDGNRVCAISYGVFGGPYGEDERGDVVWAVFVDDKFEKFVRWPERDGKSKVGAFSPLSRVREADSFNLSDLKQTKEGDAQPPSQADPGLTATWLLLGKGVEASRQRELKRNLELRNQFNAARLKLGMTEAEVESALKAKPLVAGEREGQSLKVYGSAETFDILPHQHYSNILALFDHGKLTGIYSGSAVPGGEDWREKLRASFSDLPPTIVGEREDGAKKVLP